LSVYATVLLYKSHTLYRLSYPGKGLLDEGGQICIKYDCLPALPKRFPWVQTLGKEKSG
jgi:hypothetical protein